MRVQVPLRVRRVLQMFFLEDFLFDKIFETMKYSYRTQGTCSQVIEFDVNDGIVSNVVFYGGCAGNLQGIARLVEGMRVEEVISRLKGIRCGVKMTSCPDQLATALSQI